jgi:hypothetical protein
MFYQAGSLPSFPQKLTTAATKEADDLARLTLEGSKVTKL